MLGLVDTKYEIISTSKFKKQFKKVIKQGKDISKFIEVLNVLANGKELSKKYNDHNLINANLKECHIEPDWLLIYKYSNEKLILFLIETDSHSDLF